MNIRTIEDPEFFDKYDAACKGATTEQGLDPVVARFSEGYDFAVEQTGGFTMVATVRVPAGVVGITADSDDDKPYLVAFYAGDDWDQGEQEQSWMAGLDLAGVAAYVDTFVGGFVPKV